MNMFYDIKKIYLRTQKDDERSIKFKMVRFFYSYEWNNMKKQMQTNIIRRTNYPAFVLLKLFAALFKLTEDNHLHIF